MSDKVTLSLALQGIFVRSLHAHQNAGTIVEAADIFYTFLLGFPLSHLAIFFKVVLALQDPDGRFAIDAAKRPYVDFLTHEQVARAGEVVVSIGLRGPFFKWLV